MTSDINANDVVAFCVEIGALILLGTWAWRTVPASLPGAVAVRVAAVVVTLAAVMVLWGLFASPKATFDIVAAEIAVKVLVLGGSVLAAATFRPAVLVACWAVIVVVNTVLIYVGPSAR